MKTIRFNRISTLILVVLMSACNTLDIAPMNVVQDDAAFTDSGMQAYMAALYSRLPIEDFKYSATENDGFNTWNAIWVPMLNTGENANRNTGGFQNPAREYWKNGYLVIRNANYLIETLPAYGGSLTEDKIKRWSAEAKFVRAYTYFALAKRYGGVPITTAAQSLSGADVTGLQIPRSSEKEIVDLILSDLDAVIAGMPETSEQSGRVNRNIAYAFKARVALHAASIARYGSQNVVEGVMLNGIPADQANVYFTQAYQAARAIEGKYSLYMKTWSATDKIAAADNYAALFLDPTSPETIFAKGYSYDQSVHSFDAIYAPPHMTTTYGDRFNPTLDYVELFDGLPKNEKGQLKTTNDDGTYIVYDSPDEVFENCEPRLRGTVLLPGMSIKGMNVDLRRGTLIDAVDPATPIQKFVPEGQTAGYNANAFYNANVKQSGGIFNQVPYVTTGGVSINPTGMDGPTSANTATVTGFHGRKWLMPALPAAETRLHASSQTWIDMRYAEVLLIRAEAGLELFQNGVTELGGVNLQADAFECINKIRARAGADLLATPDDLSAAAPIGVDQGVGGYVLAPTRGLQIIRIERRKELAFEHKLWWDMLRWRTADREVNARRWRKFNPFLFSKGAVVVAPDKVEGKWIVDCRFDERGSTFTVTTQRYYEPIPNGEINANPRLKQNPQY
ncbi:RagB/SusD family nutrient uptake outer membrane protein [Dawidia soli]|uniref:RagB/SusD family nutrient uptake outer membrane protein n=1 Tax=Dawidia soli TaxID=2782352 RepID=A0AAP2DGJ1_9BACT|nr:RagB/SusD family nutrient uptake outer membrane protein [Dawidia soli]MBT1688962.1 RagB/SusD family nutrient uptake outer membrane protein [Dawidia soli]